MSDDASIPIDEVITKAEFARRCNVTPGRVSQWISEGKLSGDALAGDGRASQVRVAPALAQLKRKLDIIHRIGNGHATRLDHPSEQGAPALPLGRAPPDNDPIDGEIKLARLNLLQEQKLKAEEDRALRTGRFVLAEAVSREFTRLAGQMLNAFEGALPTFARAISSSSSVPQRDVVHILMKEWRAARERIASIAEQSAGAIPELVTDEIPQAPLAPGEDPTSDGPTRL